MAWIAAFAVTMFMLSVIVSVMVETVHRFRGTRHEGLKQTIERLYEHSIAPRLQPKDKAEVSAEEFANLILQNRSTAGTPENTVSMLAAIRRGTDRIDSMPVEIFTQRLADLQFEPIDAKARLEDIVKDISAKYVTFGSEMSVAFERKSRRIAVVCALVLALAAYVHPLNLARVYLKNPELAEKIAAKGEEVGKRMEELESSLAELRNASKTDDGTQDENRKEIIASIETINTRLGELKAEGVPLGWPAAEACITIPLVSNCSAAIGGVQITFPSVGNLIWLLFGGLLVGLGAPFWEKIITSLATTTALTQKVASIVGGTEPQPAATKLVATGGAGVLAEPTAVQTFNIAKNAGPTSASLPQAPV
jgi:hypothetical protein